MNASLGSVLKRAVLAGLIAALTVSVFHSVATEPVIDRAIGIEEQMNPGHGDEEPVVSRETQKVGLVLGLLLYGALWALLYGVVYHLTQGWLPATSVWGQALLLAVMGYLSVALLPFLKYPANPPGVGDPETITYRQTLYVALLVLSIVGVWLAAAIVRFARSHGASSALAWLAAAGFVVAFAAVVYALLPANPDPVAMPDDVLTSFRGLSLVGLTLFWAVLGIAFAALSRRSQTPA